MEIQRRSGREGTYIRLNGALDDSVTVEALVRLFPNGPALIDLGRLTDCTDRGFNTWREALRQAPHPERAIIRCPQVFLDHLNRARSGDAGATLVSLLVPASCTADCGGEVPVLVDLRLERVRLAERTVPCPVCPRCGAPTALSSFPDAFGYALEEPVPTLTSSLSAMLDRMSEHALASANAFQVAIEQEAGVTALWVRGPLVEGAPLEELGKLPRVGGAATVVLRGVTGVSDGGMAALLRFGANWPKQTVVADMPMPILAALARLPVGQRETALPAGWVSAWVTVVCEHCASPFEISMNSDALTAYIAQMTMMVICTHCRKSTTLTLSSSLGDVLSKLRASPMPSLVAQYMAERPAGYEPMSMRISMLTQIPSAPPPREVPATLPKATTAPSSANAPSTPSTARPTTKPPMTPAASSARPTSGSTASTASSARPATMPPRPTASTPAMARPLSARPSGNVPAPASASTAQTPRPISVRPSGNVPAPVSTSTTARPLSRTTVPVKLTPPAAVIPGKLELEPEPATIREIRLDSLEILASADDKPLLVHDEKEEILATGDDPPLDDGKG